MIDSGNTRYLENIVMDKPDGNWMSGPAGPPAKPMGPNAQWFFAACIVPVGLSVLRANRAWAAFLRSRQRDGDGCDARPVGSCCSVVFTARFQVLRARATLGQFVFDPCVRLSTMKYDVPMTLALRRLLHIYLWALPHSYSQYQGVPVGGYLYLFVRQGNGQESRVR